MSKSLNSVVQSIKCAAMVTAEVQEEHGYGYADPEFRDIQEQALYEYVSMLVGGKLNLEMCNALDVIMREVKAVAENDPFI